MERRSWLAAILLAGAFCFTGLANHPLRASDEPRVAGIGWEMQYGNTAPIPHLGGEPFLEHPPLFYAVLGGAIRVLGASTGVARLPGAVAAFLTLLLVFDLGRRVASPLAGLSGVLLLVGARGFFRYSHKVLVDPLLALCVMLGFYAYVRAVFAVGRDAGARASDPGPAEPRGVSPGGILGVYVAASLAYYVKGPVGVAAIAGPLAVDVLAWRRLPVLRSAGHLAGLPLLLLVCVSWPALIYAFDGESGVREFLVQNGIYRVFPGTSEYSGGHQQPFTYYLGQIPQVITGWLLLVPAAAVWIYRASPPGGWNTAAIRFLGLVFPLGVLVLSIPGTKRGLYLLPFLAPASVALGAWVAGMCHADAHRSRVERAVAALCARLVQILLWVPTRLAGAVASGGSRIADAAACLGGSLGSDVAAAARGPCRAPLRLAGIVFAFTVAWNVFGYRVVDEGRDLGPTSRGIAAAAGGAELAGYNLPEEMRGALPFYTGRIATNLRTDADLARYLAGHPGGVLLYASPIPTRIPEHLRSSLSPIQVWEHAELDYTLYAIQAGAAQRGRSPTIATRSITRRSGQ